MEKEGRGKATGAKRQGRYVWGKMVCAGGQPVRLLFAVPLPSLLLGGADRALMDKYPCRFRYQTVAKNPATATVVRKAATQTGGREWIGTKRGQEEEQSDPQTGTTGCLASSLVPTAIVSRSIFLLSLPPPPLRELVPLTVITQSSGNH